MLLVAVVPAVVVVVAVAIAAFVCKGHAMTSASAWGLCSRPALGSRWAPSLWAPWLPPSIGLVTSLCLWNLVTKDAFLAACAAWALLSGMT